MSQAYRSKFSLIYNMLRRTIDYLKCNFSEFEFAHKYLQNNQIVVKTTDFPQEMQFGGISHLPPTLLS